ncbi:MAG: hypothetical protein Q7K26_01435 [bacterium]|nr:hypothetical protein [bacterium]
MPDFERLTRSLEEHVAITPEQKAYVRGKHAGEDAARWQIAKLIALLAIVFILVLIIGK